MQFGQDLLRLGVENEGWRLAREVHNKDGYNVLAHNLVALHDRISRFRSLERAWRPDRIRFALAERILIRRTGFSPWRWPIATGSTSLVAAWWIRRTTCGSQTRHER